MSVSRGTIAAVLLLVTTVTLAGKPKAGGFTYDEVTALSAAPPAARVAYGDDPLQHALHWRATSPRGTVIFVHGGCWLSAYDVAHSRPFAAAMAAAGFDSWSLEYRRTGNPGGGWPGSAEDVRRAVTMILAEEPPPPVFLIGHSAGGHLALLAAPAFGDRLAGAVGLAAITDLVAYAQGSNPCEQATREFMGGMPDTQSDAYAEATLSNKTIHANTFLLHGGRDTIVAPSHAAHPAAVSSVLADAGHFDWIHPQSDAFQNVLRTLEAAAP